MVKNISLSDTAYELLAAIKANTESFSDAVVRIAKKEKDVTKFFGIWKDDKEMGKIFTGILKERHKYKTRRV